MARSVGLAESVQAGTRLMVTTSAIIIASCLTVSVWLGQRNVAQLGESLIGRGRTVSEFLAIEAELGVLSGNTEALRTLAETARRQRDVVYASFLDKEGKVIAGSGPVPAVPAPAAGETEDAVIEAEPGVWQLHAPIVTSIVEIRREELGFGDGPKGGDGETNAERLRARERVGTVAVGMSLRTLDEQRRVAFLSAAVVTGLVTLLSVMSGAILTRRHMQSLAGAARLAEERAHVAELKARFVTSASHEFRTPLAVILSASDVINRYADRLTSAQRSARVAKIHAAVRHMTELLDDVLAFGRAEAGHQPCVRERFDLAGLCRELAAEVSGGRSEAVRLSFTGLERPVSLDPKLARQVVRNLLANAVKYSPNGDVVECEVARRDETVVIRVADHGIGISPQDQRHLFEPFHRGENVGKIQGSGLGLAITKKAVEAHGGTITVESVVGKGTTFTVELRGAAEEGGAAENGAERRLAVEERSVPRREEA